MRFVIPVHHTQGASRHHGGAATGDMRTIYRLKIAAIKRGSN